MNVIIAQTAHVINNTGIATAVAAIIGAQTQKNACQIAGGKFRPPSGMRTGGPSGCFMKGIDPVWLLYNSTAGNDRNKAKHKEG